MGSGFDNDVMYAENVDFTGGSPVTGKVTTNGQLLIGSAVAPNIRVNTLTAGGGVTITNGAGTITIGLSGSAVGQTITGDSGGALSPTAGNWNIVSTATNGIETTGAGSTLTVAMASPYGDGSFSFTRAAAGSNNILTIENTSNTASSQAILQITSGGSSAADPKTRYTVTGATDWSLGIQNSVAGDPFVLSSSNNLGTSNVLSILTTGSITHTNTGTVLPLFISNRQTDTNAASTSFIQTVTAAGSSADSYFLVGEEATRMYCFGVDDSDSSKLKINTGAADPTPSTETNLFSMTVNGSDVVFSTVNNGVTKNLTFANTDNNASSACNVGISVGGALAGDAQTTYTVTGTTNWSVGVDNSVTSPSADPFVIAASTALGTTNVLVATTAGEITKPLQPSFLALAAAQTDVTGNGTNYTVTFTSSEVFDRGGDFDGTSVFTAPVTGIYWLGSSLRTNGYVAATQSSYTIVTSNRTYVVASFNGLNVKNGGGGALLTSTILCDMDINDTAEIHATVTGEGADIIDIAASSTFYGELSE
jgi:hypothetical protein